MLNKILFPHDPSSMSMRSHHGYLLYDTMPPGIEKALKLLPLPRQLPPRAGEIF